jgi:hypothetical protein
MSNKLRVLIWAINESKELMIQTCSQLLDTAKLFNIDYELIGVGVKFKEHKQRIWILRDYLKRIDKNEIVLCMDGADTLFNQCGEQILQKFKSQSTRILFSAEKNYSHQYFEIKFIFDQPPTLSSYRYLNAGTFMGYAGDLLEMLEEILVLNHSYPNANDQGLMGIWVSQYIDQPQKVKLDIDSNIFWVTAQDWENLLDASINHDYIINTNTHTKPSVIHVTGVKFPPHYKAYNAAYNLIINSSQNKSKNLQVAILVAMPDVEDGVLWNQQPYKEDIFKPAWFQDKHPYLSLYLYNKCLSNHGENLSTSYSYEAILRLLEHRYLDYIVHVSNEIMLDKEMLYETITGDYQFITELGSEYPKSEHFIYHNGLYFSFSPPLLKSAFTYEECQTIVLNSHAQYLKKRIKKLEEINRKIEHEVIFLGKEIDLKKDLHTYCLDTPVTCFSIDDLNILIAHEPVNGQFHDLIESLPSTPPYQEENEIIEHFHKIYTRVKDPHPILFICCIEGKNIRNETRGLIQLIKKLKTKFNRTDRLVIIVPDLGLGTIKIQMLDYNIMAWAADTSCDIMNSNHPGIAECFEKIIEYSIDEFNWKYDEHQLKHPPILLTTS